VTDELKLYGEKVREYLRARPGVTGLWQVCGRSRTTYEVRTDLDAKYVREWSISSDLSILLRTLPAVMKLHQAA
jgi:exopolysaccharide production protein ExoY